MEHYKGALQGTGQEFQENVSLADVLSLRDSCLSEQDVWAVCLECSQSLKSIAHSAIFQTLCITPDTLAFNTNGNVCFMEQISDDPEGAFVPPEIDVTGNTFEAHIFSLGATLKAAIEYTMKSGIDSKFSHDLHTLLEQMQEERPKERPDIETVISLSKENLKLSSSSDICHCLSAIGRRVLSIESFGTFQDSCDNLWNGKVYERISPYEQCTDYNLREHSSPEVEDLTAVNDGNSSGMYIMNDRNNDIKEIKISPMNESFCCQYVSAQVTKCKEVNSNIKYKKKCVNLLLNINPYTSELEGDASKRNCLRKVKTFPKLPSESETDPRTFIPFLTHSGPLTRKQCPLQPKSLSLINNNKNPALEGKSSQCDGNNELGLKATYFQGPNNKLEDFFQSPEVSYQHKKPTCDDKKGYFLPYNNVVSGTSNNNGILNGLEKSNSGHKILKKHKSWEYCRETSARSNENCLLHINRMTTVLTALNEYECSSSLLCSQEQNHSEMIACYIEDTQYGGRESKMKNNEQCVFLKHLLTQYGKPLKDYELWALCHECLLTMETYINYPAYLCLDSVLINSDGSVHFVPPKSEGLYDVFYLAPETVEEGCVTEKVCIYCIAAILWRAAKYNFPPDHKVVLPRKLKNFLLDMARQKSEDRPSLADAIKTCDSHLLEQSISSKKVLAFLSKSAFQAFKELESFNNSLPFNLQSEKNSMDENLGFLPMSNESKLIAVKGPVPYQPSLNRESTMLPSAFTSSATHFKPIILHQNTDVKKVTAASTMVQWETNKERVVPVDNKNSICLNIDAENQMDENTDLPTVSITTGILEQDKQGLKTSLQSGSQEQNPSSTSSCMVQLPLFSESSCLSQEKCPSSSISNCSVSSSLAFINNFLLKQDPVTRVLTLVPVQMAVSEQIPNKPLHSKTVYSCCPSLHVLLSDSVVSYDADKALQNNSPMNNLKNVQNECWEMKVKINSLPPATINKETQTKCPENNPFLTFCEKSDTDAESNVSLSDCTSHASMDQNPACSLNLETSHQNNGIKEVLKKVVHLIEGEFTFGSPLDNTAEALAIGKYIYSLKDLRYNTFCSAISEKFCDFYWKEKLLANLYDAANGKTAMTVSTNETEYCSKTFQGQNKPDSLGNASEETNDGDDLPQDNAEKEVESQKITVGIEKDDGECLQTNKCYLSPCLPEENQEQDQVPAKMEENIYTSSPCFSELCGFCSDWSSAFYGSECFSLEVHRYIRKLGKRKANETQDIDAKKAELEQMIMIETKNYRKSIKFYQRLSHKERRSKGGEGKSMLPKLREQLEEMKTKVHFLELVKKYLQIMYIEKWGVEACNLLTVVNLARSETPGISSLDCMLLFYNINKTQYRAQGNVNQSQPRNLQAGTPLGLMAYLYSRNAFLEGYVQQFLFTFRYFCSQEELLQFLLDRIRITLPNSSLESCSLLSKIYHRTFTILQTWIEDCYAVDFTINPDFMNTLKDVISKAVLLNGYDKWLLSLMEDITSRKRNNVSQCYKTEEWEDEEDSNETKPLHSPCKRISKDVLQKNFNWKLSKRSEVVAPYQRDKHSISSALPNITEEFSGLYTKIDGIPYFLTEYTAQQLCCQLTLLEQEMFHKCHPVHFLNSRLLGVKDKSVPLQKATSTEQLPAQAYNLFVKNCVQDDYLLQLLKHADNVSNWVAAEIVTSYSSKIQVTLLSKLLFIAKCCYEHRNFATAMQILKGLENLIVRQLPVWKSLPSKVSEIMEELKAVEVFLKSDSLCLMEGERFKTSPTIPSAHVLAMHVQQLETGGFTMRNGTYKWTKLRNIAKVVSQVHAFQENPYRFPPDHQLQSFLRQRIASFSEADISALAADNYANFYQIPPEKQSRKIQDTLHRMKAMFQ
ncbi:kinase non-catalytic C-lobe domain-containing protein 1 isoform X2 [Rhineura floridana]|uniref:kinase non-catalytic C-lobe domain-containing protein 1 isoform X2 n=1 Tax=Rhineura floridana TaxID=261503 RepID=UPI002AC87D9D|nr:kinase non-catalytic C-lobe domain-containing protein 1 isoform X2 [Rhineura floridana]